MLLDAVVFLLNVLAAFVLAAPFERMIRGAVADDQAAMRWMFAFSVALFVLAPAGATLKRWHFHRRRTEAAPPSPATGCLFNPIVYFCLVTVIFAMVNAFVMQRLYGNREPSGAVFVSGVLLGIALIIVHMVLVFRYFSRPRQPPRWAFMRSATAETLGDACLFANMLLFQLVWNALSFAGVGRPGGLVDIVGRLLLFEFLALLLYFPPRMFYLAADINKRGTWLMIALANVPVVARLVLGSR